MFNWFWIGLSLLASMLLLSSTIKEELNASHNAGDYTLVLQHLLEPHAAGDCTREANNKSPSALVQQNDVMNLVEVAFFLCATDHYTRTGPILAQAAAESIYIPVRLTIPYEVTKRLMNSGNDNKVPRCSDLTAKLYELCPAYIRPQLFYSNTVN